METNTGKESIVSRLFGFGKKRRPLETEPEAPPPVAPTADDEQGFARTDTTEPVAGPDAVNAPEAIDDGDEPSITVPEQIIRIRTSSRKDDAVNAIGDSFRELSTVLSSVNDRLDRQDDRAGVLAEHLSELPEYLRTLPRLQEQQNTALEAVARAQEGQVRAVEAVAQAQEGQVRAVEAVAKAQEGQVRAVEGLGEALDRIPDALRDSTAAQEQAIRKVAAAQQQTAKVMHHGNQKSLQAFHQATEKSLLQQRRHVDTMFAASQRMFKATVIFMAITIVAVVAVLLLS